MARGNETRSRESTQAHSETVSTTQKKKGEDLKLRNERLKEVIREEAAETILHDLTDPRLGFCTVTRIELTNDLSYCTI